MPRPFFNEKKIIESMMRVNHAGEKGAIDIYEAQLKYIKCQDLADKIRHMQNQEYEHLAFFEFEMKTRNIDKSVFLSTWNIGAEILGYITAKLGKNFVMITTESIESVISEHYQEQINFLTTLPKYDNLRKKLIKIRQEEISHHDICNEHNSDSSSYKMICANYIIKYICKIAIFISKRV